MGEYIGYTIETGSNQNLVYLSMAGCVLTYVAILYNVFIMIVLSRPNLRSPTTVLMQGLAIADTLTAFCSYGLEPLFQVKYVNLNWDASSLTLEYPYCALYVNLSQLVDLFHIVSVLLTTCLGIQKALALKFPFWVRTNLKIEFAVICCAICFTMSLLIHIPRHFAVSFANRENISFQYIAADNTYQHKKLNTCSPFLLSEGAFMYGTQYYPLVSAIFLLVLSGIMCLCVLYIGHRLCHKKFKKKNIIQRKRERRSVLMITTILVIFLVSEIPRLSIYGYLFFGDYLDNMLNVEATDHLSFMVTDYRATLAVNMKIHSGISFSTSLLIIESLKVFSLIGCMSNFVIYITMSKQLRHELKSCFPFRSK